MCDELPSVQAAVLAAAIVNDIEVKYPDWATTTNAKAKCRICEALGLAEGAIEEYVRQREAKSEAEHDRLMAYKESQDQVNGLIEPNQPE